MQTVKRLSDHFLRRWRERVGGEPDLEAINRIVDAAHRTRGTRTLYARRHGGRLIPVKLLTEYWNPDWNVILRIDDDRREAVTVIVPDGSAAWRRRCRTL